MKLNKRIVIVTGTILSAAALLAGTAFAQSHNDNTRPGWGHGDDNHIHTGPPGQSVHPGDKDDNGDDDHGSGDHNHDKGDDQGENNNNQGGQNHGHDD